MLQKFVVTTPTHPLDFIDTQAGGHWHANPHVTFPIGHEFMGTHKDDRVQYLLPDGKQQAILFSDVTRGSKSKAIPMNADGSGTPKEPMRIFGMKPWVALSVAAGIAAVSFGVYKFVTRKKK